MAHYAYDNMAKDAFINEPVLSLNLRVSIHKFLNYKLD